MTARDPTSLAHGLPPNPVTGSSWSVEQIAALQQDLSDAAAADASPAGAPGSAGAAPWGETHVSGTYRSAGGHSELELRVDVDGVRPTRRVSGDFFQINGRTRAYLGSFVVNAPRLSVGPSRVVIEGLGSFSFPSASPLLRISIPGVPAVMPRASATVQFLTSSGAPGATFTCEYVSEYFRAVEFEVDCVEDVKPFDSYDTSKLPSGGRGRLLTVPAAYAEAGVEMIEIGDARRVPISLAGSDRIWSTAELHAAMHEHFQRWTTDAGWRVWLLAATIHEKGPGLRGLMFDSGRRQGCAVFHDVVGGSTDQIVRAMLRTYVHELGHCFNLYHSHQKRFMNPPQQDRMDALSWMHYPAYYRAQTGAGESAYWRAFPFQFDDDELVHLRHGFRNAVVPGGQPFGVGAAELASDVFADRIEDESGLRLKISAPERCLLGTPVVAELKLSLTDLRGRSVNRALHPNMGYVQIGIQRLGGHAVVYRPLLTHCVEPDLYALTEQDPAVYESAYIGYGKDGHYFDSPGEYALRAVYNALDGSIIVSDTVRLRVVAPLDRQEDELATLFLGDSQGALLYLLGSDSRELAGGRKDLQRVIENYPEHPLANYARLVEGWNASRPFKQVNVTSGERKVEVREPDAEQSTKLLDELFKDARRHAEGGRVPRLDNISLNMAARRLARVQKQKGDRAGAARTAHDLSEFLINVVKVPKHVERRVARQIARALDDAPQSTQGGPRAARGSGDGAAVKP